MFRISDHTPPLPAGEGCVRAAFDFSVYHFPHPRQLLPALLYLLHPCSRQSLSQRGREARRKNALAFVPGGTASRFALPPSMAVAEARWRAHFLLLADLRLSTSE